MKSVTRKRNTSQQSGAAVSFTLNGRPTSVEIPPGRSLLTMLREKCGIISPKNGCEPQGACGCCTVLIDEKPRLACTLRAEKAEGRRIVTAEGLPPDVRDQTADCFVQAGGVQCGFCIPGIAMRAVALLERNASPSRAEIAHDLRGNLCRCTGYTKIVDAIELMARARRGEPLPPADDRNGVGAALGRYRGGEFVLGDFRYIDDIQIEGSLFAAMRFSDHPRALIRSIDAAEALGER